jgi:hypothetical protein
MLPLMAIPFRGLDWLKKSYLTGTSCGCVSTIVTGVRRYQLLDTEPLQLDPDEPVGRKFCSPPVGLEMGWRGFCLQKRKLLLPSS